MLTEDEVRRDVSSVRRITVLGYQSKASQNMKHFNNCSLDTVEIENLLTC